MEQKIQQQRTYCKVQDGKTAHFIHVLLKLFKMLPAKSVFDYDCLLALRKIKQGKSYVALASVRNAYLEKTKRRAQKANGCGKHKAAFQDVLKARKCELLVYTYVFITKYGKDKERGRGLG